MTDSKEVFPDAGRELDALIAEKVMRDVPGQALGPQHYSTDLAAAWLVVEKMNNDYVEFFFQADAEWDDTGIGMWGAKFGWPPPDGDHPLLFAKTAPLAICRAALRALQIDGPIFPPDDGNYPAPHIPFSTRLAQRDRTPEIQRAIDRTALIQEAEEWAALYENAKPPRQKLATAALFRRLAAALLQAHNENGYNARITKDPFLTTNGPTIAVTGEEPK